MLQHYEKQTDFTQNNYVKQDQWTDNI